MRARINWSYIFTRNFLKWKAWQLASEIVVALSEQNVNQAFYLENSFFRTEQLTVLFSAQKVLLISSKSLLHYDVKRESSSEKVWFYAKKWYEKLPFRDEPHFSWLDAPLRMW